MVDLQVKALAVASDDIAPSEWKRYVDDIITVVKRKKGQQLLEYLSTQHGQVKFTMEEERERERERERSLPFTNVKDIKDTKDEYGQVVRPVCRKPTVHISLSYVSEIRSHWLPCPKSNRCVQQQWAVRKQVRQDPGSHGEKQLSEALCGKDHRERIKTKKDATLERTWERTGVRPWRS